ncbi:hypothetical protein BaRGS_00021179, partial [Batillaria attramentaria]
IRSETFGFSLWKAAEESNMSYRGLVEFLVFFVCVKAASTLKIRQEPRAVYNNQTGQFHVQLTCISHHGTTRAVIWTNPLGHELNSSSSDGDEFRLLLPNPVTSGLYDCCALAPNAKTTCLEFIERQCFS